MEIAQVGKYFKCQLRHIVFEEPIIFLAFRHFCPITDFAVFVTHQPCHLRAIAVAHAGVEVRVGPDDLHVLNQAHHILRE